MRKNSKNLKDVFKAELQSNILYPERYRYFDDDYARENFIYIRNVSLKKKLQKKAVLGKIIFDYKKNYNSYLMFGGDFIYGAIYPLDFLDAIACMNIFLEVVKHIDKNSRSLVNQNDFIFLRNYFFKFSENFKSFLIMNKSEYGCFSCFHPFVKKILEDNSSDLIKFIRSDEYKSSEANFIRLADYEKNKIKNFFRRKFLENEKIFVCRFDVIFKGSRSIYIEDCSVSDLKKQLILFFDFVKSLYADFFESGLEVIFPSKIVLGRVATSHFPIGQIILVATKKISTNKKTLKAFSSTTHTHGLLDFKPAVNFSKDLTPNIDGVLSFTPSVVDAIDLIADFLTLERRYVCPLEGLSVGSGRPHCFQIVNLKS